MTRANTAIALILTSVLPRAITHPPLRLVSVQAVGSGFAELHHEVPPPPSAATVSKPATVVRALSKRDDG